MRKALMLCAAFFFLSFASQAQSTANNWDSWQFLLGTWTGEGSGQLGRGTGTFSFHFDLRGKILVRKNRSDYPATKDRPAFSHEDLMVIYPESGGARTRAIYFDNEENVIHYTAKFSQDQNSLVFLSDPLPSAPRFRLTYAKAKDETLTIKFEIAPPGKPDSFSPYLEGVARRIRRD